MSTSISNKYIKAFLIKLFNYTHLLLRPPPLPHNHISHLLKIRKTFQTLSSESNNVGEGLIYLFISEVEVF